MQPNSPMSGGYQPTGQPPTPPSFQPQTAAQIKKGGHGLLIALVLTIVLLIVSAGFAVWAYGERDTYKNKTDKVVATAVAVAEKRVSSAKDNEFQEKEKLPTRTYGGPATFGSVQFSYPKTWSAYIDESGKGSSPVDGYLHPNYVPGKDSGTAFALRLEVVDKSYDDVMREYEGAVKSGKLSVAPFRAENVLDVLGSKITGAINKDQKDTMVVLPIRDKTLRIWTESEAFVNDFNTIILKSLKFVQ